MYRYDDLKYVHMEVTSRCNAACPQCARNVQGGADNPRLPIAELSLADVKTIFPPEFVAKLKLMYMCGNYGDALVAKDTVPIFEYFREQNPTMTLHLHTNASGRTPAWWQRLAKVVSMTTFSVDGLEDTNHIYRRSTEWRLIRRAMDAYIGAGGKAEWAFLVFKHNEHQVEEARALAKQLGFVKFRAKRTHRFMKNGTVRPSVNVRDRFGKIEYQIEPPENPLYRNDELVGLDALLRKHGTYDSYLETTEIDCKAAAKSRIFVSAEGMILPCCWIAAMTYSSQKADSDDLWKMIEENGGKDSLIATKRPLRDIIEGPLFQSAFPKGWAPGKLRTERIAACARYCGKCDTQSAQHLDAAE
jgi:MoaA/NifB/PqqE/SkfB family radical SAM enzyme